MQLETACGCSCFASLAEVPSRNYFHFPRASEFAHVNWPLSIV
jgi:hypothetical protein